MIDIAHSKTSVYIAKMGNDLRKQKAKRDTIAVTDSDILEWMKSRKKDDSIKISRRVQNEAFRPRRDYIRKTAAGQSREMPQFGALKFQFSPQDALLETGNYECNTDPNVDEYLPTTGELFKDFFYHKLRHTDYFENDVEGEEIDLEDDNLTIEDFHGSKVAYKEYLILREKRHEGKKFVRRIRKTKLDSFDSINPVLILKGDEKNKELDESKNNSSMSMAVDIQTTNITEFKAMAERETLKMINLELKIEEYVDWCNLKNQKIQKRIDEWNWLFARFPKRFIFDLDRNYFIPKPKEQVLKEASQRKRDAEWLKMHIHLLQKERRLFDEKGPYQKDIFLESGFSSMALEFLKKKFEKQHGRKLLYPNHERLFPVRKPQPPYKHLRPCDVAFFVLRDSKKFFINGHLGKTEILPSIQEIYDLESFAAISANHSMTGLEDVDQAYKMEDLKIMSERKQNQQGFYEILGGVKIAYELKFGRQILLEKLHPACDYSTKRPEKEDSLFKTMIAKKLQSECFSYQMWKDTLAKPVLEFNITKVRKHEFMGKERGERKQQFSDGFILIERNSDLNEKLAIEWKSNQIDSKKNIKTLSKKKTRERLPTKSSSHESVFDSQGKTMRRSVVISFKLYVMEDLNLNYLDIYAFYQIKNIVKRLPKNVSFEIDICDMKKPTAKPLLSSMDRPLVKNIDVDQTDPKIKTEAKPAIKNHQKNVSFEINFDEGKKVSTKPMLYSEKQPRPDNDQIKIEMGKREQNDKDKFMAKRGPAQAQHRGISFELTFDDDKKLARKPKISSTQQQKQKVLTKRKAANILEENGSKRSPRNLDDKLEVNEKKQRPKTAITQYQPENQKLKVDIREVHRQIKTTDNADPKEHSTKKVKAKPSVTNEQARGDLQQFKPIDDETVYDENHNLPPWEMLSNISTGSEQKRDVNYLQNIPNREDRFRFSLLHSFTTIPSKIPILSRLTDRTLSALDIARKSYGEHRNGRYSTERPGFKSRIPVPINVYGLGRSIRRDEPQSVTPSTQKDKTAVELECRMWMGFKYLKTTKNNGQKVSIDKSKVKVVQRENKVDKSRIPVRIKGYKPSATSEVRSDIRQHGSQFKSKMPISSRAKKNLKQNETQFKGQLQNHTVVKEERDYVKPNGATFKSKIPMATNRMSCQQKEETVSNRTMENIYSDDVRPASVDNESFALFPFNDPHLHSRPTSLSPIKESYEEKMAPKTNVTYDKWSALPPIKYRTPAVLMERPTSRFSPLPPIEQMNMSDECRPKTASVLGRLPLPPIDRRNVMNECRPKTASSLSRPSPLPPIEKQIDGNGVRPKSAFEKFRASFPLLPPISGKKEGKY